MTTLKELQEMDEAQIIQGYNASREGYTLNGLESVSFVHGWKNGQVDFHGEPISTDQVNLAREYVKGGSELK